jgi:hypothetical protein
MHAGLWQRIARGGFLRVDLRVGRLGGLLICVLGVWDGLTLISAAVPGACAGSDSEAGRGSGEGAEGGAGESGRAEE